MTVQTSNSDFKLQWELCQVKEKLEAAQTRIRDLERAIGAEFIAPKSFNLTRNEERFLGALVHLDRVSRRAAYTAVYDDYRENPPGDRILDVFLCKLRAKLKPYGITIETLYGAGWSISPADKDVILALCRAGVPS